MPDGSPIRLEESNGLVYLPLLSELGHETRELSLDHVLDTETPTSRMSQAAMMTTVDVSDHVNIAASTDERAGIALS